MHRKGLTTIEVNERINEGKVNNVNHARTKTIKEIVVGNIFTYFNILNIALAVAIIVSGVIFGRLWYSLKNCLFLGVAICNTVISIVQEVMSKKTIDKLSLLSNIKPKVIRDGEIKEITNEEIVLDDIIQYQIGSQVLVDSKIVEGSVEVNSSFITGEVEPILMHEGEIISSGCFIVSGECLGQVIHVGNDNYINTI